MRPRGGAKERSGTISSTPSKPQNDGGKRGHTNSAWTFEPNGANPSAAPSVARIEKGEVEFVDLGPLDVVSFPPGMVRRFENVTKGDPNMESVLMFVIGGDGPRAEFTDQAMERLEKAGVWSPQRA